MVTITSAPAPVRSVPVRARVGQVLLTVVLALSALVAISTMFVPDPFEPDATVLIASFGTLAAVLGLAAVWGGSGSRVVRVALWAIPLFFIWHVAALGTWIPDAFLAVLSGVGILLLAPPRGGPEAQSA